MPKRKSTKTNSSPSQEDAAQLPPAILRVVKQKDNATDDNNPAQSESASTTVSWGTQPVESELEVNNNQSQSIEVSSEHSSPVVTSDAIPQTIRADNEQSDFPLTVETDTLNIEESTATKPSTSDALAEPKLEKELRPSGKELSYKKLETATNSQGQTFTVGEKIEVSTCNFGIQQAVITFLYSAPDGSIWSSYNPLAKEKKQEWRRGCCRIEYLKKLSSNPSNG